MTMYCSARRFVADEMMDPTHEENDSVSFELLVLLSPWTIRQG